MIWLILPLNGKYALGRKENPIRDPECRDRPFSEECIRRTWDPVGSVSCHILEENTAGEGKL